MKRSLIFVHVLVSLFIFQSLWNVAAAFCLHETETQNIAQVQHFGHHQTMNCEPVSNPTTQISSVQVVSDAAPFSHALAGGGFMFDDHHDHLPSFAHYIVKDVHVAPAPMLFKHPAVAPTFFSGSLYQSPDLSAVTPPPELTPL